MSGATALKKINARVKQLKKRHPNAKRSTLQKQAGKEFKAGKLKKRKKAAPRKKVVHHRKKRRVAAKKVHRRRKAVVHRRKRRVSGVRRLKRRRVHTVVRRRKRRVGKVRTYSRRRVSGMGKSGKLLLIGAIAVGAYLLLRPKAASTVYIPTGSTYRDSSANNIIAIAQAAGIVGAQLTKLIQQINSASDTQVQALSTAASAAPASLGDDSAVQQILANSGGSVARIMG